LDRRLDLQDTHESQGIQIDASTAVTRWGGERMDYGLAVHLLLEHVEWLKGVCAGTSRVPRRHEDGEEAEDCEDAEQAEN
jgi:hypothetical protein